MEIDRKDVFLLLFLLILVKCFYYTRYKGQGQLEEEYICLVILQNDLLSEMFTTYTLIETYKTLPSEIKAHRGNFSSSQT